jgi:predicted nucleic acid-binding Zn ribbon protein
MTAMPIYTYQIVTPAGDGAILEIFQPLGAAPLTQDPATGAPLSKLITAPNLPLKHGRSAEKTKLSDANLNRTGFTKYVREGKGRYVKTAGHDSRAPSELRP